MTAREATLSGILIIEPLVFLDARGFFDESYNAREFEKQTGVHARFLQDSHSRSSQCVLGGLHYQIEQEQGKLIRVVNGEVFELAAGLATSSSFGQWPGVYISATEKCLIWIPEGFAYGFLGLPDTLAILYKAILRWAYQYERCILGSDPALGDCSPLDDASILSSKDQLCLSSKNTDVFSSLGDHSWSR